jgi:hypothetical protein
MVLLLLWRLQETAYEVAVVVLTLHVRWLESVDKALDYHSIIGPKSYEHWGTLEIKVRLKVKKLWHDAPEEYTQHAQATRGGCCQYDSKAVLVVEVVVVVVVVGDLFQIQLHYFQMTKLFLLFQQFHYLLLQLVLGDS